MTSSYSSFVQYDGAGRDAAVDVVVEAGARVGAGDRLGAGAPREELLHEVERAAHGAGVGVRPEVARAVLLDAARDVDARPRVCDVDLQVRVVLVVLEADVEERLVALDQRRPRGAAPPASVCVTTYSKSAIASDERARLRLHAARRAEVGAHAAAQARRLADVDHVALRRRA